MRTGHLDLPVDAGLYTLGRHMLHRHDNFMILCTIIFCIIISADCV